MRLECFHKLDDFYQICSKVEYGEHCVAIQCSVTVLSVCTKGSRFPYIFLFVQEVRCLLWLPGACA